MSEDMQKIISELSYILVRENLITTEEQIRMLKLLEKEERGEPWRNCAQ